MQKVRFLVNDSEEDIGAAWAHLQDPNKRTVSSSFSIYVPNEYVPSIFDPKSMKPREQSFNEWIEYFARTDGTIAIDYFLGQIRDVCSIKRKPYCWVIEGHHRHQDFHITPIRARRFPRRRPQGRCVSVASPLNYSTKS